MLFLRFNDISIGSQNRVDQNVVFGRRNVVDDLLLEPEGDLLRVQPDGSGLGEVGVVVAFSSETNVGGF